MLLFYVSAAIAADPPETKFIREGMSEGDVLMKIGKPDSESVDRGAGAVITVKRWMSDVWRSAADDDHCA